MKFTLDWLKDHLETTATTEQISEALTLIGLEVESVTDQGKALRPFVVAKVVEAKPHPNSDHLKVCKVDAGTGTLIDVVCGAPNAVSGMKSVFAAPGTWIPGKDFVLKAGVVIRGEKSDGMLCSAMELQLSEDHEGIIVLPDDAPVGVPYVDYAKLGGVVFDVSITPNRGDATSVRGIARDLAAYGLGAFKDTPVAVQPSPGGKSPIAVELRFGPGEPMACRMFAGRLIRGVRNGPSPDWMQARLRAVGLRPISALVDIT
ncbi:MAG: YtpR family tRNA-binding protein, partial [Devosia sp.]